MKANLERRGPLKKIVEEVVKEEKAARREKAVPSQQFCVLRSL